MEHLFRVRGLADRYQLLQLRALAETRLAIQIAPENVLSFLGRVIDTRGVLEQACWKLFEESGQDILHDNETSLSRLAAENPELARAIMLRACKFGSASKRRRQI